MGQGKNSIVKVLIVDDDREYHELYELVLGNADFKGGKPQFYHAYKGQEALDMVAELKPDIVTLDINMPGGLDGIETCSELRKISDKFSHYMGIIFVTSLDDPSIISRAFSSGADEFCVKPHVSVELAARVNSVMRIKRMTEKLMSNNEKLRKANARLQKITIKDELTGLYNMRYFKRRMRQEFARAMRYEDSIAVIMFDLDHFKQVNDQCDHLMGSFVISEVGHLVEKCIRETDIGARFGGDEYVVLLPKTDEDGARHLAERLLELISSANFDNGQFQVRVTASIGVSVFSLDRNCPQTATELLQSADRNLYKAKELGRGCVVTDEFEGQPLERSLYQIIEHKKTG